jgi:hypothetical protein
VKHLLEKNSISIRLCSLEVAGKLWQKKQHTAWIFLGLLFGSEVSRSATSVCMIETASQDMALMHSLRTVCKNTSLWCCMNRMLNLQVESPLQGSFLFAFFRKNM